MQVKCAACGHFVPVEEKAYRYCADCGEPFAKHPNIPDVRTLVESATQAKQKLAKLLGALMWGFILFIFFGLSMVPPQARFYAFVAAWILQVLISKSYKIHLAKTYPQVFTNEWFKP